MVKIEEKLVGSSVKGETSTTEVWNQLVEMSLPLPVIGGSVIICQQKLGDLFVLLRISNTIRLICKINTNNHVVCW